LEAPEQALRSVRLRLWTAARLDRRDHEGRFSIQKAHAAKARQMMDNGSNSQPGKTDPGSAMKTARSV